MIDNRASKETYSRWFRKQLYLTNEESSKSPAKLELFSNYGMQFNFLRAKFLTCLLLDTIQPSVLSISIRTHNSGKNIIPFIILSISITEFMDGR